MGKPPASPSSAGLPRGLRPMLATAGDPPAGPGWAVEFKWDGIRALAASTGPALRFTTRNGNDVTAAYPDLTGPAAASTWAGERPVLLDGEIVALDAAGRPDFGLLQQRMQLRRPSAELLARVPVAYYVFDVLRLGHRRLLTEPYDVRRAVLHDLGLDTAAAVGVPPQHVDVDAGRLLEVAREHGLEGIVCKRRSSRYEPGRRSPAWIKTALLTTQEVVVGGWTSGRGRRADTIGALLLGAHDHAGALRYLGSVGTGFTAAALAHLHQTLLRWRRIGPRSTTPSRLRRPVPRTGSARSWSVKSSTAPSPTTAACGTPPGEVYAPTERPTTRSSSELRLPGRETGNSRARSGQLPHALLPQ